MVLSNKRYYNIIVLVLGILVVVVAEVFLVISGALCDISGKYYFGCHYLNDNVAEESIIT
jgi:hypothetical protein